MFQFALDSPHSRLGVKYISEYLSTSTSTLKPSQVQVQVHHLIYKKHLSTMQVLVKVLKYKYKYI